MTVLDSLKAQLARQEAKHGPNDFMVQQLRRQIEAAERSEPAATHKFTLGARRFRPAPGSPPKE